MVNHYQNNKKTNYNFLKLLRLLLKGIEKS